MIRLGIGLALIGGAAYFGRRHSSGLSAPPRSYLERTLSDVGDFAVHQFKREEIVPGDDFLVENLQMECPTVSPYLTSAARHLEEALDQDEADTKQLHVLVNQAWAAAVQPMHCGTLTMPSWLLKP